MVVAVKIKSGQKCHLFVLEQNGRCELLDFVLELRRSFNREYAKLMRAFAWTADSGPMFRIPERFKRLNEKIFEFKTRGGVRILCFFDGSSILVLTNGFKKKKKYADELTRAEYLMSNYMNAKASECLTYREEVL